MQETKLYLFIGYPGAGKTAIAKIIADKTQAFHIWADVERHRLFPNPTHTPEESDKLYGKLNQATEYLLGQGKSVIFDTNFNHKADRDKLKAIAKKYKAKPILIWVKTPLSTAMSRAVDSKVKRNNYNYTMTAKEFHKIASKLEPPTPAEKAIVIDGTNIDKKNVLKALSL